MHPSVQRIGQRLRNRDPRLIDDPGKTRAAVAAILRCDPELELLLIQRARVEGDPWSGHLGFPGGKIEEADPGERQAAERETREELGLDLAAADYLGRLDDLTGATLPVLVSSFAYHLAGSPDLDLSQEVEEAFWVPAGVLTDAARHRCHTFHYRGGEYEHEVIDIGKGRPLLWGLTYRFTVQLLPLTGDGTAPSG